MGILLALVVGVLIGVSFQRSRAPVNGASSPPGVPLQALNELRRTDPEAARGVETAAAVPVDDVPNEVTAEQASQIAKAASEDDAVKVALRFVKNQDAAEVIAALARWKPRRRVRDMDLTESEYEASLARYLERRGFSDSDVAWKPRVRWGKDQSGDGAGRVAVPDLRIKTALVELKADLMRSDQTDRALGQMLRYLYAWKAERGGCTVLAICGDVHGSMQFLVRIYVNMWRTQLGLPVTVFFKRADGDGTAVPDDFVEAPAGTSALS